MKSSAKNKIKKKNNLQVKINNKKRGVFSGITHSMKRYGKNNLRKLLLSKIFHSAFKILTAVLIIVAVLYGAYSYFYTSLSNDVVVSKSEIIDRVSKLVTVPDDFPDAVVRVEDAEVLKSQNNFYSNVKVGDYIIMYPKLAIIYDLRNNTIVAMKKTENVEGR
ncbi:hypothetical protein K9M47_01280 [Candidatus Gracilibacteria bacterium]|nr:hypothetical protein [Candidatus Gracilibacteria bacterium]MCF7898610.1 hypothetical protein [Candidatus Paceibacterota bacterium]